LYRKEVWYAYCSYELMTKDRGIHMKKRYFLLAGILALALVGAATPAHAADPDAMYVRHIEGSVSLSEAGSPQAMEAVVNTPLIEGDTVATGAGKAELFLKDGSMVRIGGNSVIKVIAVDDKGVQFKLEHGSAYIVSQGSREFPVFLDTPFTAVDITSPSTVRVDTNPNGVDEISVLNGSTFASREHLDRLLVSQGQRLIIKADGSMPVMARLRASDNWMRWNLERDAVSRASSGASESYAYLPEELKTYSPDLDNNGQWIYTPEYNYVWVPTVIVAGGWSPYRFGRWTWIRGSYVWIGYEPWGWAPYHYGRWVHHRHAGWCWVPPKHRDVRWEPAHVAWIHSSRNVSWVPLAPGERYDRHGAPKINQVNIYNTTYKNVTIERSAAQAGATYKNASAANSMVTVERDRMLRQKMTTVAAPKPGPAMFKRVSLPSTVTPARAQSGLKGRQIPDRSAPPAEREAVTSRSMPLSKDIPGRTSSVHAPANPQPQPPVGTRQLSDTTLNSRIESARYPGRNNPAKSPGPQPLQPTVSSRRMNGARQDVSLGDTVKRDAQRSDNAVIKQPEPRKGGVTEVQKTPASQPVQAAAPLHERIQANPPPPAVKAETKPVTPREPGPRYDPAARANQTARPASFQGRSAPVVTAPRESQRTPEKARPEARVEPAKTPARQAVNGQHPAPSRPAVEPPQPVPRPAPQAAKPAKYEPVPERPAKNDARPGPDKNKPHA
jgi:hypothetical protein